MFFANARCESREYGIVTIAICSDYETEQLWEDTSTNQFYRLCCKRPIAQEIMKAAALDVLPVGFTCNEVYYTLISYNHRPEERFYNEYRKNHVVRKERLARNSDIYVYLERCRCTSCYFQWGFDSIENVCGLVQTRSGPMKTVEIDVQHCRQCGKYFVDMSSLKNYEKKYGLLRISKHYITGNEEELGTRDSYTYKENTVLSRNGYSTQLLSYERRNILSNLIVSGKSSKAEIKDILTRFISQRGKRNPNACAAWESDLEFVNDFDIQNQDVVRFI